MESTSAPQESDDGLNPLYKKLDQIAQQQNVINQEREIILAALILLEPDYKPQPQVSLPDFLTQKNEDPSEYLDIEIAELTVNFAVANTQLQRFFLLCETAHIAGKLINTGKCAQYLIDHQQSTAKYRHLKGSLSRFISNYSDYFEMVKPGTYKYMPEGREEPDITPTEYQDSSQ